MKKIPIKELQEKASKGPFTYSYNKYGGYDCMTASYDIEDFTGETVCSLDLRQFGQEPNIIPDEETNIKARSMAQLIAHCLNNFDPFREDVAIALGVMQDAPELNMSNYSHDDVALLNTAMCEAYSIIKEALKAASFVEVGE